jgi:hypothetical protein
LSVVSGQRSVFSVQYSKIGEHEAEDQRREGKSELAGFGEEMADFPTRRTVLGDEMGCLSSPDFS